MNIEQLLACHRPPELHDYPELEGYSRDDLYHDLIGGGGLYLSARMARTLHCGPGDTILDLGCGKGETSIFLARHFGARIAAVDLWHSATYLSEKFRARGFHKQILPLHLDASRGLPFAECYFDAIFCQNSFSFYGGSVEFVRQIASYLVPGGEICIGSEVLSREFTPEQLEHPPHVYSFRLPPPNDTIDLFEEDFKRQHTRGWWHELFQVSGALRVTESFELEDSEQLYAELCIQEYVHQTDPFDVDILLEQLEWGRSYQPSKKLFVQTAVKAQSQ